MKLVNTSSKVINIGSIILMPDEEASVSKDVGSTPAIAALARKGLLKIEDSDEKATAPVIEETVDEPEIIETDIDEEIEDESEEEETVESPVRESDPENAPAPAPEIEDKPDAAPSSKKTDKKTEKKQDKKQKPAGKSAKETAKSKKQ